MMTVVNLFYGESGNTASINNLVGNNLKLMIHWLAVSNVPVYLAFLLCFFDVDIDKYNVHTLN